MWSPHKCLSVKYRLTIRCGLYRLDKLLQINFMDSGLQQLVASSQLADYATRVFIVQSHRPTLLFFLVIVLAAVGYDYGNQSICAFVFACSTDDLQYYQPLPFRKRCASYSSTRHLGVSVADNFFQIEYIWVGRCSACTNHTINIATEQTMDTTIYIVYPCMYPDHVRGVEPELNIKSRFGMLGCVLLCMSVSLRLVT